MKAYSQAIRHNVLGAGWGLIDSEFMPVISWNDFEARARLQYANDNAWISPLRAIQNDMAVDDLVWIYNSEEHRYYLGRVLSEWKFTKQDELRAAELWHIRDCHWVPVPLEMVPGAVRISRSIVRGVAGITEYCKSAWNELTDSNTYARQSFQDDDVWKHLSYADCEDAVSLYLQFHFDLSLVPSSCKTSTPLIEYMLVERRTGEVSFAQVKSGDAHLDRSVFGEVLGKVFIFSTSGKYINEPSGNVIEINKQDLEGYLRHNLTHLPPTLRFWFKVTGGSSQDEPMAI